MADTRSRPMSPHLTIWRWGPNMTASIVHRASGIVLSIAGLAMLTWWLVAIAGGSEDYARFLGAASHPIGIAVLIGLTLAFFLKLLLGVRHLVTDTGANLELNANKRSANLAFIGAMLLTAVLWAYILGVRP